MLFLHRRQLDIKLLEAGFRFGLDMLLLGFLRSDFSQVSSDLRAALTEALLHFGQLDDLDLQTVYSLRQHRHLLGQLLQSLGRLRERAISTNRTLLGFVSKHLLSAQLATQIVDFLLARQHAVLLGISSIKTHRQLAHHMTLTRYQTSTGR